MDPADYTLDTLSEIVTSHLGPVQLYGNIEPNSADGTYALITDPTNIPGFSDSDIAISAASLKRDHVVVYVFENVQSTTTFELEVIRRLEGLPTDENQSREKRSVQLPNEYSTTMDILRKVDPFPQKLIPLSKLLDMEGVVVAGFWDMPVFHTLKNVAKFGLDELRKSDTVRDAIMKAAPNLTNLIVSKIPGLDVFAPAISNKV